MKLGIQMDIVKSTKTLLINENNEAEDLTLYENQLPVNINSIQQMPPNANLHNENNLNQDNQDNHLNALNNFKVNLNLNINLSKNSECHSLYLHLPDRPL